MKTLFRGAALFLLAVGASWPTASAQELTLMTYHLGGDAGGDGADAWPARRTTVAQIVNGLGPDLLGVQGALPRQVAYLDSALAAYDYIGEGSDGRGGGEHAAIFYRRDRLEVGEANTIWLSPTPREVSVGWGASRARVATYGRFRERGTAREVFVVNTRLDPASPEAQRRGLALIEEVVAGLAEPGLPAILMGDLGAGPASREIERLRDGFADVRDLSLRPPRGREATYVGFDGSAVPARRTDYLLVRRGGRGAVDDYAALDTRRPDGRYPSDHLPVYARVRLATPGSEAGETLPVLGSQPGSTAGRYGADFVEEGSAGVGIGLTRASGTSVFSAGLTITWRVSPAAAIGGGVAYASTGGSSGASATGIGAFGRLYLAAGAPVDPFVDAGPSVAFADGSAEVGFALSPGLALTGRRGSVRAVVGVGGLAVGSGIGEGQGASNVAIVFAPSIGIDALLGRRAAAGK